MSCKILRAKKNEWLDFLKFLIDCLSRLNSRILSILRSDIFRIGQNAFQVQSKFCSCFVGEFVTWFIFRVEQNWNLSNPKSKFHPVSWSYNVQIKVIYKVILHCVQFRNRITGSRSNSPEPTSGKSNRRRFEEELTHHDNWRNEKSHNSAFLAREYEDVFDNRYSKYDKYDYDEYDEVNEIEESNDVAVQTYLMTVSAGGRHQSSRSPGQTPRRSSRHDRSPPKTPRRNHQSSRSRSTPRDHRPNLPERNYSRAGRTPRPRARYINPYSRI